MSDNITLSEVEKFNQMAAHWWDLDGHCKPLHQLNPLRLEFIERYCALPSMKVLDVGCGGGILSEALAKKGAQVTGIDMGEEVLAVADAHQKNFTLAHPVHYQKTTAEDFAAKTPELFDAVTCFELLEHVPDPKSLIQACCSLVKPGGSLFFSTLNRTPKAFLFAIVGAEYLLNLLPRGTHSYQQFIKPAELAKILQEQSYELKAFQGLSYNPLVGAFSFSQNVDVNYLLCAERAADVEHNLSIA